MKLTPKTMAAGGLVYFTMSVGTYLYLRSTKPPPTCTCQLPAQKKEEEEDVFDRIADVYDRKIGFDETFMGVKLLRWWLLWGVQGDVMEVSAGTGRNLPYYDLHKVKSLTLTDTSRQMLLNARDKFEELQAQQRTPPPAAVKFSLGDGHHLVSGSSSSSSSSSSSREAASCSQAAPAGGAAAGSGTVGAAVDQETRFGPALRTPQTFEPGSFDYVVDTFGLCSHDDPVQVLKEMARACKPGGKILLLEHGRSSWGFVNGILDNGAQQHKDKWGCWWNRDIAEIVRKAGLKVDSMSRFHFGTTYMIVAEPAPQRQPQSWRARS